MLDQRSKPTPKGCWFRYTYTITNHDGVELVHEPWQYTANVDKLKQLSSQLPKGTIFIWEDN